MSTTIEQAQSLIPDIAKLTNDQFVFVQKLVRTMATPVNSQRAPDSDLFPDDRSLGLFFLYLVTHHLLSPEPFKKEKFEYAVEQIMLTRGKTCARPPSRTNPGLDLTVDGERWSFKSEAHTAIKADKIWVSKWMELGKGKWASERDLKGLCQLLIHHLRGYDRIFTLRCMTPDDPHNHKYELWEIPKSLLLESAGGEFTMQLNSRQRPKPGYCRVRDDLGSLKFELYFDGGTERKLQVKNLLLTHCRFHASWSFSSLLPVE